MKKVAKNSGFSLFELLIVIVIVAILVAIAVPSYQNFVIRSKVTELIALAAPYKTSFSEHVAITGAFPEPGPASDAATVDNPTELIGRISFARPFPQTMFIEVWPSNKLHPKVDVNKAVVIRGMLGTGLGSIKWDCGTYVGGMLFEFLPAPCRQILAANGSGDDPGTDDPGTDDPGTDDPGTDDPGTDDPGTDDPGTDDPGTDDPGTDDPGTDDPGTDDPSKDDPGDDDDDDPSKDDSGDDNDDDPSKDDSGDDNDDDPSKDDSGDDNDDDPSKDDSGDNNDDDPSKDDPSDDDDDGDD